MKIFEKDWLASKWVDFEYKKYILLSYLQQVKAKYDARKVYPYLLMLRNQQEDLRLITTALQSQKPNALQVLLFGEEPDTDQFEMDNLMKIAEFALPKITAYLEEGESLEEFVMRNIEFRPVGVLPFDKSEGYLIFRNPGLARIYRYQLGRITPGSDNEIYSTQLKTWFLHTCNTHTYTTTADIKYELIKTQKDLPNPATFSVECNFEFPFPETLVPVGRKLLHSSIVS